MSENAAGQNEILTVLQLNVLVKKYLEGLPLLKSIYVKGEISNLTVHSSGHYYFTLKDSGALVRCVMFKSAAVKLVFAAENGLKVVCGGRIAVYEKDGQFQLYVTSMKPDGVGELYVAYEQLKKKLTFEGLFDEKYKKPLPKTPFRVGIITSPTGAAVRDIIKISRQRFPAVKLILYPALVQGEGAPEELVKGLEYFNINKTVDVIIIGRGGGSLEDLYAFNNEQLARAVFKSKIPVVSAVGHETDFTITDYVADVRAATPSAAAQLCLPDIKTMKIRLKNVISRMCMLLQRSVRENRAMVSVIAKSKTLSSPLNIIDDKRNQLINYEKFINEKTTAFFDYNRLAVKHLEEKLQLLNPYSPLNRGYILAYQNGNLLKNAADAKINDKLILRFADGDITADIRKVNIFGDKINSKE